MTLHLRAALTSIEHSEVELVVTSSRIKGLDPNQIPVATGADWQVYHAPREWPAQYVLRAKAGHWQPNSQSDHVRRQWYRTGLAVAEQLRVRSLGFATGPSDPGVWPLDEWVLLAITSIRGTPTHLTEVVFCCSSPGGLEAFAAGIIRSS